MKIDTLTIPKTTGTATNTATNITTGTAPNTTTGKPPEVAIAQDQKQNAAQFKKFPPDKIENAVKVANNMLKMFDAKFEYSYNKDANLEVIKVIDKENNQEIRQYPAEEIVNMLTRMYDMIGLAIDKKV
jgi:flagellar protein FlaG